MRASSIATAFAAALTLTAAPLAAAPWTIDKAHTAVAFSVDHLGFSLVNGVFREFDATVDFDPENMETASVSFTIRAASVDTFWEARDKHLRSGDFLDVEAHPEITFTSKQVRLTGPNTAEITGDVTIKGETREETFVATLRRIGPSPFNPDIQIAGLAIEGEIDRTEYGVDFGAPAIGATIPIRIDTEISPAG
ncbi:YceI family protein [Pikeienuella piscinae]|uniref:YceI family protein n=1 Tax=Pikeienuella piscinae TaxID=2748098 RepID=A0A7L5BUQ9_9RHOB|nr:YceI family protein [Pikeienuella piscinae]QIE55402.1 YceI family protein [Pikeienuella piscinae]